MNDEWWQQVKEIFRIAIELEPRLRKAFLDNACGADERMRQEVESLVNAHEHTNGLMEKPALVEQPFSVTSISDNPMIGKMVGHYRLMQEIGRGGMGTVYLAVRDNGQYRKQVAVKIVKSGLDSENVIQRFQNERQALAMLDHPNIAKLIDGGTTDDGRPYFVLEYIEGLPIDEFCDTHKLITVERLKLFRQVCAAIHYAHQNLLVHRDIKPGNILVTRDGVVKLLDFGIAKFLNPDLSPASLKLTTPENRPMTPNYASPEQVRGEPLSIASDIYSLGVLLYELLTGHRPYRLKSRFDPEIERIICEQEPEKPSTAINRTEEVIEPGSGIKTVITPELVSKTRDGRPERLRRRLTGDIDNIVLMAMRKEPQRRYASAEQLSEDIFRHLQGQPVIARKDTLSYRSAKFIKRHKTGVATTIIVAILLVAGIIATTWQAKIARTQRNIAAKAASAMIYELADGLKKMSGPTEIRLGLLLKAESTFEAINQSKFATPELKRQNADANRVLAQTFRILGENKRALKFIKSGEKQARELTERLSADMNDKALLASILLEKGDLLNTLGKYQDGNAAIDSSLALAEEIVKNENASNEMHRHLAVVLSRKGDRLFLEGKVSEAENYYRQSLEIYRGLVSQNNNNKDYLNSYAISLERLGDVCYARGDIEKYCTRYREALQVRHQAVKIAENDPIVLQQLAITMQNVAWCAEQEDHWTEAAAIYTESIAIQQRLYQNDPGNVYLISNLIGGMGTFGMSYMARENYKEAIIWLEKAMNTGEFIRIQRKSNPSIDAKIVTIGQEYAEALLKLNQFDKASNVLNFLTIVLEELASQDSVNIEYKRSLARVSILKGDLCSERKVAKESLNYYQQACAWMQQVLEASDSSPDQQQYAFCCYKLGLGFQQNLQIEKARQAFFSGKKILLDLYTAGQLSETSEGYCSYLSQIEKALGALPK